MYIHINIETIRIVFVTYITARRSVVFRFTRFNPTHSTRMENDHDTSSRARYREREKKEKKHANPPRLTQLDRTLFSQLPASPRRIP